jgi:Ca-activated chloride channel family protein
MPVQKKINNYNLVVTILSLVMVLTFFQKPVHGQESRSVQNKQIQSEDEIIRVDSTLITVPATVFDRDGRYVTNLKKEDFEIYEDGIPQEIAFFEPVEKECTVFLLLDVSGSMVYDLESLTDTANAFLHQLRPDDKLSAASFADRVNVLFEPKSVKDIRSGKKIKLKIIGLPPVTMVYDAVDFALKKMSKIRGRKAIILFSDGIGSGYSASAKSNWRDAEEQEALIYTVTFDTNSNVRSRYETEKDFQKRLEKAKFANNYMRELADITGGRHYEIEKIKNLQSTFGSVAEELSRQYSLGYYSKQTNAGKKQIKVKVRQPNLAVRARDSYVIEAKK